MRTLDALHLASTQFLRERRMDVHLASYDRRMRAATKALAVPLFPLS